jgi:hypothetical protein
MSISPTEDALIVALDFEGGIVYILLLRVAIISNFTRIRRPQSRAFSPGGHASRSF